MFLGNIQMRLGNLFFSANKTRKIPSRVGCPPDSTSWVLLARWSPIDSIDGCLCLLLGQYRAAFGKPKCLKGAIHNSISAARCPVLTFRTSFCQSFCALFSCGGIRLIWFSNGCDILLTCHKSIAGHNRETTLSFLWFSKLQKNNETIGERVKKWKKVCIKGSEAHHGSLQKGFRLPRPPSRHSSQHSSVPHSRHSKPLGARWCECLCGRCHPTCVHWPWESASYHVWVLYHLISNGTNRQCDLEWTNYDKFVS